MQRSVSQSGAASHPRSFPACTEKKKKKKKKFKINIYMKI